MTGRHFYRYGKGGREEGRKEGREGGREGLRDRSYVTVLSKDSDGWMDGWMDGWVLGGKG